MATAAPHRLLSLAFPLVPRNSSISRGSEQRLNSSSVMATSWRTARGGLLRAVSLTDQATQNYPGTFTFTSLEAYRITVVGLQNKQTAEQISDHREVTAFSVGSRKLHGVVNAPACH